MRIEMVISHREIRGNQAVGFEVFDGSKNVGTFIVGKGGIGWKPPKGQKNYKGKTWRETQLWLEKHGRIRTTR